MCSNTNIIYYLLKNLSHTTAINIWSLSYMW